MRRLVPVLLLCAALPALAQDDSTAKDQPPPATADYSRPTLIRIFADDPDLGKPERRIEYGFGYINFKALNMRWRIGYLPFLAPMQGSQQWLNSDRWPDPFILTGTQLASPPRTWRQMRDMNAELRRIEKKVRASAKVTVKPE